MHTYELSRGESLMGGQKKRVAILGGGVSGMAAAFGITEAPNWQDQYEITVYQLGWRLGGKGAAGRNAQLAQRIEEHGLHVWGGFYENAFRLIRACYEELDRQPGVPLATWDEAFLPEPLVSFTEALPQGWLAWNNAFPQYSSTPGDGSPMPSLESLGFERTNLRALGIVPGMLGAQAQFAQFVERIDGYDRARDFPAKKGVSYLSVHNRFGTISIRELARAARARRGPGAQAWLSELVWRDFFFQVLWHFPRVERESFRAEYATLEWPGGAQLFDAWREGRTGYPIVDAAMRQLARTGFMHNRLRMIAASFLAKDLLVDWRIGEAHFMRHLVDGDVASNNGGWQWSASTGTDPQPYFRIFNPTLQGRRFDPDGAYVRRWVPELARVRSARIHEPWSMTPSEQVDAGCRIGVDYPAPIVDHAEARARALAVYEAARRTS